MNVQVVSPNTGAVYTAGVCLGGRTHFTLYECRQSGNSEGKCLILKIASAPEYNGELDREVYILEMMRNESDRVEAAYAAVKSNPNMMMNYKFAFPAVVETFVSSEQNGRRVTVLDLSYIANRLADLIPLSHLASKQKVRVDPRTGAWILGKVLKLFVFTHDQGICTGAVMSDNLLINPDKHFVCLFDWSRASVNEEGVMLQRQAAEEIAKAAQIVTLALGGDLKTGQLPPSIQLTDTRFADVIRSLALGKVNDASQAHTAFYDVVESLWPHGFHPFTTHQLG